MNSSSSVEKKLVVNSSALIGSDIISEVDLGDLIWVTCGCGRRYPLGSHFDQSHIASSKNGFELFVVFLVLYVCILIFCVLRRTESGQYHLLACQQWVL